MSSASKISLRWLVLAVVFSGAMVLAGRHVASASRVHARAATAIPPHSLTARRLRPRAHAVARGTVVPRRSLFGQRVFANSDDGFALANRGQAQYPVVSGDGGRSWRIDGPQLHIDAADAPEAVGSVGLSGPRTLFAYGSSVIDVTTDHGRTWWETFMGELVMAVVPGPRHHLVAFVQQSVSNSSANQALTWQYVSRDGGRHWRYSRALGGG